MGILQKLFGSKRPSLKKTDIPDFEKVTEFVILFVKNDPIVNAISNQSSTSIFNKGYRPRSGSQNNPESLNPNISSLVEWFITRMFMDLNILKDATRDQFRSLIDIFAESGKETLITTGTIGMKYGFNFENYVYEREIKKIPQEELGRFEESLLQDNVYAAETRVLAWLYHDYFGEWYKIKEKRDE